MDKENVKRSFNNTAEFFLCLTIFIIVMTIINCFLKISSYKGLGFSISDDFIAEIIVDILIIVAAVFTLMKKKAGLIALIGLFLLRTFAPLLSNTDTSTAYLLGGKIGTLIRDVGPFAIAMCFKKNGISGWKSMLASEEYVAKHTIIPSNEEIKSVSAENTDEERLHQDDSQQSSVDLLASENISTMVHTYEKNCEPEPIQESVVESRVANLINVEKDHAPKEPKKTIKEKYYNLNKYKKAGILSILALIILFSIMALAVSFKSYPDYISSFGDKLKYTFNLPNNRLAQSLMNHAVSQREKAFFLIAVPGYDEDVFTADKFYRNRAIIIREYPSAKVSVATKQVNNAEDISSSQYYIIVPNSSDPYSHKGSHISSEWDFYGDKESRKVYQTKEYDFVSELAKEMAIVDKAASIPVSGIDIIKTVGGFYEQEGNLSKASDYYRFVVKKNRNNPEIRGMLAYSLALNGDYEEAKEMAAVAIKKNPKETKALSALAIIESEAFNWGEAKKYAQKAIDYGAEDSNVYYVYCAALYKQGEVKAAQTYYNKAYELARHNPRRAKYSEFAGPPFEILDFHFGATSDSKRTIPFDEKLVSSKCFYIDFRIDVNYFRYEEAQLGIKLFKKGVLCTGDESKDGFTYIKEISGNDPGNNSVYLMGWGNPNGGFWTVGLHRIEVWYKGEKIGEDTFHVY